ncbi:MAG: hypothetical protein JRH01_16750 [Deltaproteobacteria bacterium]|nr:hypothetical protein [Deltaproteobacteria bacterium]MBW2394358.1 hypothetical protein [Deltaproteobacteria bacterium]
MNELQQLAPRPETHEIRVRFASRASLVAGLTRAKNEPWVERARIDLSSRELVLAMAGGGGHVAAASECHVRPHLQLVPDVVQEGAAA